MSGDQPRKRFRITSKRPALPGDGGGAEDARVEVVVRSMGGEEVAKVRLPPTRTVSDVKSSALAELGVPLRAQKLLLQAAITQDRALLSSFQPPLAFTLVVSDFDKAAALKDAVRVGHEAAVRWLLDHSLREEERREMLPRGGILPKAAWEGHEGVCRALLGAAPNAEVKGLMLEADGDSGRTALIAAVDGGHAAICRLLLGAAPNPRVLSRMLHATDLRGGTALHWAAERGHDRACRVLFEAAPDTDVRMEMLLRPDELVGETALHVAASCGHLMTCRALLEAAPSAELCGEILGVKNCEGCTALDLAGDEFVSQLLQQQTERCKWEQQSLPE